MSWRRFEQAGALGDYIEIRIDGSKVTTRTGKGPSRGRDIVKDWNTADAATAAVARQIELVLQRGYSEPGVNVWEEPEKAAALRLEIETANLAVREQREAEARRAAADAHMAARQQPFPAHSNPDLEALCDAAADDDPAPWSVYADWLIERGDRRGTIASHFLRGDQRGAEAAMQDGLPAMCGFPETHIDVTFVNGFARGITIGKGQSDNIALFAAVERVLASPMGRFATHLRFGLADGGSQSSWATVLAAVVASSRAHAIKELRFDNYEYDDSMLHFVDAGDLSQLAALPALESVSVRAESVRWGPLPLPHLKKLVRETTALRAAEAAALFAAPWPALEHLDLWFGNQDYGCTTTVAELEPLLAGRITPKLAHLGLMNCDQLDAFIEALAKSALLPQLSSLDLSMGTLAAEGAAVLARHAKSFRHLAAIELGDNMLEEADEQVIIGALDNVVIGSQRYRDDDDGMRYVAEHE